MVKFVAISKGEHMDTEEVIQRAHDYVESLSDDDIQTVIQLAIARKALRDAEDAFEEQIESNEAEGIKETLRKVALYQAEVALLGDELATSIWHFHHRMENINEQEQQREPDDISE